MSRIVFKDYLGWGFLLWLVGYILGIVLFMFVPASMIGWILTPVGSLITIYVLLRKVKEKSLGYYVKLGFVWMVLAMVLDYVLLVQLFEPEDGYYKADVYLYYLLTLVLPPLVGWYKLKKLK